MMKPKKARFLIALLLCTALTALCACVSADTQTPSGTAAPADTSGAPLSDTAAPADTSGAPSSDSPASGEPGTEAPGADDPVSAETEPSAVPDPTPETDVDAAVRQIMARMTLREKIAQMCFVMPEALPGMGAPVTAAGEAWKTAFDATPVGGVILMGANLTGTEQTKALCAALQACSESRLGLPVFIGVDEEGGDVARVSGNGKFGIGAVPRMASVGASGDPSQARGWGRTVGAYLRELGFDLDFAPVADVLSNAANTVVKTRSFGADGDLVALMTRAFAEGLQSEGVRACYKHFPGHGATAEDSHKGFAVSYRTKDELWDNDLIPFADAAREKIPFIMSGHISLPNAAAEDLPASLNYEILTGLLRGEIRYDGIIITDALNMGAITQRFSPAEVAVLAVKAGNDMLLIASDVDAYVNALTDAVASGEISEARIDESVYRILREKLAG